MTNRAGHVQGSSARNDVRVLVRSTLGEIDFQPRSMPLRIVADMASMALPLPTAPGRPGLSNVPCVQMSRPSMTARLRTTSPCDRNPSTRRTEPLTFACTRFSVYPPGLRNCAPAASRKLPIEAARSPRSPPVASRFCSSASPSMLTPWAARRDPPSGALRIAPRRQRLPWMRAPLSRTVPATGTCWPTVTVDRSSVLVRSSAVRPGACGAPPGTERLEAGAGGVQGSADTRADQPHLPVRGELVQQPDVAGDVHAVGLDGALAVAVDDGIHAQQPAAYLRLAQPDRRVLGRAGAGAECLGHVTTGQVEGALDPHPVGLQAGQVRAPGQDQPVQPGALGQDRRGEPAALRPQPERHVQAA